MDNFDTYYEKKLANEQAERIIETIQRSYYSMKNVQNLLAQYQNPNNIEFRAAVQRLFTTGELNILNSMIHDLDTVLTDWETNYQNVLNIGMSVPA
jgi:hypothetical protein